MAYSIEKITDEYTLEVFIGDDRAYYEIRNEADSVVAYCFDADIAQRIVNALSEGDTSPNCD